MRVFPKAIVLTTKSHFHVKRTYASIRGLVVRTITSGKTRISAITVFKSKFLPNGICRYRQCVDYIISAKNHRQSFSTGIFPPHFSGGRASECSLGEDGVKQQFIHSNSIIFLMTGRDSIDFCASLTLS